MTPNKLPKDITDKIKADATAAYADIPKFIAYTKGATGWALWKVKHDELKAENERLNESCNKLFKQSCKRNNECVDLRSQAQRMADALDKCVQFKGGTFAGKYLNVLLDECEAALQQFKDGGKGIPDIETDRKYRKAAGLCDNPGNCTYPSCLQTGCKPIN